MLKFVDGGADYFYSALQDDRVGEFLEKGRLPGPFGTAQSLVEIWATPSKGVYKPLWVAKNGMATVALLRSKYLERKEGQEVSAHTVFKNWLEENKYARLEMPDTLIQMLGALLESAPRKTVVIKDKICVEVCTMAGHEFAHEQASAASEGYAKQVFASRVYSRSSIEEVEEWVRSKLWERFDSNILLTTTQDGRLRKVALTTMPKVGSYISPPGNDSVHNLLVQLPERCVRFAEKGISRNVLLYGPPGTGKSTLAMKLAQRMGNERTVRVAGTAVREISSRTVIDMLAVLQPEVIVMDDIDRDTGLATTLMAEMDSSAHSGKVSTLIASVNSVGALDPALLRPGRFSETYEVVEPSEEHRLEIICHYVSKFGLSEDEDVLDLERVLEGTDGFSPADVEELLKTLSVVGEDMLEPELERLRKQRGLYSGDACDRYQQRRTSRWTVTPDVG